MAGLLEHSPADIVRYLIVAHSLGSIPSGTGRLPDWSVFSDIEPDRPDNCITVYNTAGRRHGRTYEGRIREHYGIQIRIRSRTPKLGFNKIAEIANELDESVAQENVIIGSSVYCVHTFSRAGSIAAFPLDSATPTRRIIHTFNGLVVLRQRTIGTGTFS